MKRVLSMFLVLVMAAPIAAIAETAVAPESQQSQKKQVSVSSLTNPVFLSSELPSPFLEPQQVPLPMPTDVIHWPCLMEQKSLRSHVSATRHKTSLLDPPANMMLFFQRIPSCLPRQLLSVTAQ